MIASLPHTAGTERRWGDQSLLQYLKSPTHERYEIRYHCPEVTFVGRKEQPDFACVDIMLVPTDRVIELKSLKRYLYSFRESLMCYERFINVLYQDLMATYQPQRLVVRMQLRARGGISSRLKIDSAWRVDDGNSSCSVPIAAMTAQTLESPAMSGV